MHSPTVRRFKDWFWQPPRPHGSILRDRVVTNLELFYDLVYVAVIGQAAHHLAEDVSVAHATEFAVVFGMIWLAWLNGSLYLEIHGRQDGRTRTIVFVQMAILVLLAVFAGDATGDTGGAFAITYAVLLAVMTWLWQSVRGRDAEEYRAITAVYVIAMLASIAVVIVSAFLPASLRVTAWAALSISWVAGFFVLGRHRTFAVAVSPTESMVERFGLFAIIVLGEVVIGVVDGLSSAQTDLVTIATGLLALGIGFGFWWAYFDLVGRRMPRSDGLAIVTWMMSQLPITAAIAAAGAAMVSLIEHAHDPVTPTATAALIAGSVALGLAAVIVSALSLEDARRLPHVYRPVAGAMTVGALAALGAGWLRPAPWVLALLIDAMLSVLWLVVVGLFLRAGAWSEAQEAALCEVGREGTEEGGALASSTG
jgi:low temperature requirement protein LtrA